MRACRSRNRSAGPYPFEKPFPASSFCSCLTTVQALLAAVFALGLITGMEPAPATSPVPTEHCAACSHAACPEVCEDCDHEEIEPESRIDPERRDDEPKVMDRLGFGLRCRGSRFRISGESTEDTPSGSRLLAANCTVSFIATPGPCIFLMIDRCCRLIGLKVRHG